MSAAEGLRVRPRRPQRPRSLHFTALLKKHHEGSLFLKRCKQTIISSRAHGCICSAPPTLSLSFRSSTPRSQRDPSINPTPTSASVSFPLPPFLPFSSPPLFLSFALNSQDHRGVRVCWSHLPLLPATAAASLTC